MAKTRIHISAEGRERRKKENKKLVSKYVPLEYYALCLKMLGNETRLPKVLMYYQKLLSRSENVVVRVAYEFSAKKRILLKPRSGENFFLGVS